MVFPLDGIVRSLFLGSLYSLMALGLTMTYRTGRFPNFAHGELITIGAYVSAVLSRYVDFTYSIVAGALISAAVGIFMYAVVCGPLLKRVARTLFLMVATFSLGLVIRSLVSLLADVYGLMNIRPLFSSRIVLSIVGVNISTLFLWAIVTSWVLVIALHLFLTYTKTGTKMRAAANNPQLATVCGINADRMATMSWAVAGAFGGIAGAYWGAFSNVTPFVGWLALLTFFAASVVGGLTSFFGTVAGGYVIAFAENLFVDFLNVQFGVDVAFKPLVSFVVIVAVLLLRPTGIAGLSLSGLKTVLRR